MYSYRYGDNINIGPDYNIFQVKKIIRSLANDISFFNLYFHWEMFLFPLNAIIVIGVYPIF